MQRKNKRKEVDHSNFPRVTKILSVIRTSLDDFLERGGETARSTIIEKAEYGTQVHRMCEKLNKSMIMAYKILSVDDVSEENYFPEGIVAFSQYRKWLMDNVESVVGGEMEVFHGQYKYMGHLDIIVRMKGEKDLSVVDIKTPETPSKVWYLQCEAYRRAFNNMMQKEVAKRSFALITTPKGCKVNESRESQDSLFGNFLYAKSLYQYMKGEKK
jgi:hypothetical protein